MTDLKPKSVFLHWNKGWEYDLTVGVEGWFHTDEGAAGKGVGEYIPKPKPSTDFIIPKANPYEDYLTYDKGFGWTIGYYEPIWEKFVCVVTVTGEEIFFRPSHWLPMPDAPDT